MSVLLDNVNCLPSLLTNNNNNCVNCSASCGTIVVPNNDIGLELPIDQLPADCNLEVNQKNADVENVLRNLIDYDDPSDENQVDANLNLFNYLLRNTIQLEDGYLQMPILWNGKMSHMLGKNFNLSMSILKSMINKSGSDQKMKLTDEVFKTQLSSGIIDEICDIDGYLKDYPTATFMPHMSIVKLDRLTTKTRVVYLSHLSEKGYISHNQAIFPGLNLNNNIIINFILMRLNKFLLIFDITKAFHNICLSDLDSSKFLFIWFRNVENKDYTPVYYRSCRLPFGLPCSPAMLMVALYRILLVDDFAKQFDIDTRIIYQQAYMDNLSYSSNAESTLSDSVSKIVEVFKPYNFKLQQFATNSFSLQQKLDEDQQEPTPESVQLLGVIWNRTSDVISSKPLKLDEKATTTREVLASLASNYDPMGYSFPLLNRARMFVNELQNEAPIKWDSKLSKSKQRDWLNICNQINSSPPIEVPRHIGSYEHSFTVHCFTDTSKMMYGYVIYFENEATKEWNFIMSKGRVISRQLSRKSIPALECHALCYGIEKTIELVQNLSNETLLKPLLVSKTIIWTDSLVSLSWLDQFTKNEGKLNSKRNVFVLNRLNRVEDLTKNNQITVKFIPGSANPSDNVTRAISHRKLIMSNFITGPDNSEIEDCSLGQSVEIPRHLPKDQSKVVTAVTVTPPVGKVSLISNEHVVSLDRFSDLDRLVKTLYFVFKFIVGKTTNDNLWSKAMNHLIQTDQRIHFGELFEYLDSPSSKLKDVPAMFKQFKIFRDKGGLLRISSKFGKNEDNVRNPILLARNSTLSALIIRKLHEKMSHAGTYSVVAEFRKNYYLSGCHSAVKSILQQCIHCRRFNSKAIKLNQSDYREFRTDPPAVPFRSIYIDFFGPYYVVLNKVKSKVWILILTCLWSRAVNLKIVHGMDVKSFLLAFQIHINEYGLAEVVISDMGSNIVPAGNIVMNFLNDVETQSYFDSNNIRSTTFDQFYKGNSSLGSIVEICVKLSKRLIYGSIKNRIVEYSEFEYVVSLAISCINKRPIAFKEKLRANSTNLDCITPEMLIRGFSLNTINVVPGLHDVNSADDYQVSPECTKSKFEKLCKVRQNLIDIYEQEFLQNLIAQAVDKKHRFTPVKHNRLDVGDIVLIKEPLVKPQKFELGIIRELQVNRNNETTGAIVFKGSTRELLRRHSSTLIKLLSGNQKESSHASAIDAVDSNINTESTVASQSRRKAARECEDKNKYLLNNDLV